MNPILIPVIVAGLFLTACSKRAGSLENSSNGDNSGSGGTGASNGRLAEPPLLLSVTDDKAGIAMKLGKEQAPAMPTPTGAEEVPKKIAPQPVLINGKPLTIQAADEPVPVTPQVTPAGSSIVTQTPVLRAQARTQAMEQMLRARRGSEKPETGKQP